MDQSNKDLTPTIPAPSPFALPRQLRNWRKLLAWALIVLPILVLIGGAFVGGWVLGNRKADHFDPFGADLCRRTASQMTSNAMYRRNVIWKVWNEPGKATMDDPDAKLAMAIGLTIHPSISSADRGLWIEHVKARSFISDEALKDLTEEQNPFKRARSLRAFIRENLNGDELMRQVLCDQRRVSLFLHERSIPLERLPNGKVP
jgi:hypothetical protein